MRDKIFADGFHVKRSDNAPEFVVCSLSVNIASARATFKNHTKNGWLNLTIMRSREGNLYVEVDTWEPSKQQEQAPAPTKAPQDQSTEEWLADYDGEIANDELQF